MSATKAQAQLTPILAKVTAVAQQNAKLPVGPQLQHLADAIAAAEKVSPTDVTQLRSAAGGVAAAARKVVVACASAAK